MKKETEELSKTLLYQHVEVFPEVLGHEAKEGEEGPSKAVKAGITIVGVSSSFHTSKAFWTSSEGKTQQNKFNLINVKGISKYTYSLNTVEKYIYSYCLFCEKLKI